MKLILMENITIRNATISDIELLQNIGRQTFSETFAPVNTEENMRQYLKERFSLEKLTTELCDKNSLFFFAESNDNIIGYLKLNFGPSQTELKDEQSLEIERIYVIKEFQGKKVGQVLYEKAIQTAEAAKVKYIWLGVWEENTKAIGFYKRNGFVEFDKHVFKLGDSEQTDIMMKRAVQQHCE